MGIKINFGLTDTRFNLDLFRMKSMKFFYIPKPQVKCALQYDTKFPTCMMRGTGKEIIHGEKTKTKWVQKAKQIAGPEQKILKSILQK